MKRCEVQLIYIYIDEDIVFFSIEFIEATPDGC